MFFFTDSDSFVSGDDYYYKFYTQNDIGNYSFSEDSPVAVQSIPRYMLIDENAESGLSPVQEVEAISGRNKVYLRWKNPTLDPEVKRVKVYRSRGSFSYY